VVGATGITVNRQNALCLTQILIKKSSITGNVTAVYMASLQAQSVRMCKPILLLAWKAEWVTAGGCKRTGWAALRASSCPWPLRNPPDRYAVAGTARTSAPRPPTHPPETAQVTQTLTGKLSTLYLAVSVWEPFRWVMWAEKRGATFCGVSVLIEGVNVRSSEFGAPQEKCDLI